ncbi:MAG: 50S ribosomal protein L6 [Planctomycetota bacterium]
MSRIGKKPITIPSGAKASVSGSTVTVEGPKGQLSITVRPEISVSVDDSAGTVTVERQDDERASRSYHGMTRSLIANMVEGVTKGFSRSLEVYGVGFGVQLQGRKLSIMAGCSHPLEFDVPEGLEVNVEVAQARGDEQPARFTITGADKQAVGEFAAEVRMSRPPEPYKGKGIRYTGEYVRRKVGKAFAGTGAA